MHSTSILETCAISVFNALNKTHVSSKLRIEIENVLTI
jgi:hypothetical protein